MRYLLDTCVVSELVKPRPAASVVDWIRQQPEHHLFLSVVTLGEIQKGIQRLASSARKSSLQNWLDEDLRERFAGRIWPIDDIVALRWGQVQGHAQNQGRTLPVLDGLIAATALSQGATVVTRNLADLAASGVSLLNPWDIR